VRGSVRVKVCESERRVCETVRECERMREERERKSMERKWEWRGRIKSRIKGGIKSG
jgi:hypothetical protein